VAKRAKVTDFRKSKKKVEPPEVSILDVVGLMKPLYVPSVSEILEEMRTSKHAQLQAFVDALEHRKRGEKVDLRRFSDL